MATDNNVNEFENGNENEVNEAPKTEEKLSNHAKKKRYKDYYAQVKKKQKLERNAKAAQQQSSEQNSQNNVEQTDVKQANPEPAKLDTHALFQQIENNVLNPRKENNVVVEPKPKEEPKPVYSVPPIPGMNSDFKRENINDAPKLTEEERKEKELADAKAMLARLNNIRTGTTQERADRAVLKRHYQEIINKYKSSDEMLKESLELAEKARREAKERDEREKQLKELENSAKNGIIAENAHAEPPKPNISEQLKQQRPVMSSNLQSWLDEDDDVEKENVGLDANDQKKEATEREVEDPMAELKATILKDMTKKQPERHGLSKEDVERLIVQSDNVLAMETEVLTNKEEAILSSVSNVKPLTKEETQQLDTVVAQAKEDELKEQTDIAVDTHNVNRNISKSLPDVELDNSVQTSQNSRFDQLLNSYNDEPEPQNPSISEQLKQQRPVMSSNLQSWLDEDDDIEKENVGLDANDKKEEATEQEVEDPMAELKATILNDMTKEQPEHQELSKEDVERLIVQNDNIRAMAYEAITKEDIDQMHQSALPVDKVLTKEETKQIDEQVEQAKKDSLGENDPELVSHTKADIHDVFLPHVEFDDEKEIDTETKDQTIDSIRSKVLLNDDEADAAEDEHKITYEIRESVINSGNESINTHTLNMPAYNSYWIKQIEKDRVTQPVRTELNNILKAAGVKENDASALADNIHGPLSQTVVFDNSINRENINMHDMAAKFFRDSYAAIDKANLGPKNRIVAAQNIADLMIKNYSPIAFVNRGELGQYTDKYVAQNKALLKDQLEKLNVQNVDTLIGGIEETLANGFQYDQSEPAVDPNPVRNVNNEQKEDPNKPRIPDFYKKLGDRMDSKSITDQAISEITDIIKATGITDENRVTELSNSSYSFVKGQINNIYDKATVPETRMSQDAPTFFSNAYDSLEGSGMSKTAQIITAQKIANVMIKNYSPVAFIEQGFEQYANDYVLNNRAVLKSQLEMRGLDFVDALIDNVDAVRDGRVPLDSGDTEFTKWLNGRIDSPAVFGSVYNELSDILQNAGFTDQDKLAELVRFTQHYGSRTVIDSPHLDGDDPNMHDIAVQFFEDSYQMLESAGLSTKDRVITAQKVSDVLLKNYSPAATEKDFEQYANNYVLGNTTLLKESLEKLGVKDIDTLIADRDIVNASGSEKRVPDMVNGARLRENPRVFMLDRTRNGRALTNIRNSLVDAGITEDAAQNLDVGDILEDAYSIKNISTDSISMRDVAKHVFVSTYNELTKKELDPNNKIETVQKITDVILKNYSPIIRNKALDKYANNYVINDKDLLQECLTALNAHENKEIVGVDEEKNLENIEQKENVGNPQEPKPINEEARVAVYEEKLKAYNNMYKLNIDSNKIASSVTEAWELMTSGDKQKLADGQKIMNDIFKDTLKKAFDVEKGVAYDEHRLPEYADIIKSTNELMRSAMYGFTDMYHNPNRKDLFTATAFGGLNAKDIGELTTGKSLWSMDQKSDEAWDIQAEEAKNIADKWLKEDRPYEKMINEMNALVKDNKKGNLDLKEMYNKLTAAEWLLVTNEKMMVENPEDPLNPIPNWGNRYWKTLTETREALGIPKHTSMRDLIQLDYAESAKAVENRTYNEKQIFDGVLDPADREMHDSLDVQKEQFATLSSAVTLTKPTNEKNELEKEMTEDRVPYPVNELDQRVIMLNEPKNYNFIIELNQDKDLKITIQGQPK